MVKHKLKNIANRPIPVDGTNLKPNPGQIVEAEITTRNKYLIQNKFFEDLGIVEEKAKNKTEEKTDTFVESMKTSTKKTKKRGKKASKEDDLNGYRRRD